MICKNTKSVALLSLLHFFVDFQCALLIFSNLKNTDMRDVIMCTVIYNGLAFAFQFLFGAFADLFKITRLFTIIGPLLITAGGFSGNIFLMSVIIGLGNGLFHIGAGRETLKRSKNKASLIGVFVAPGAMGIFLGPVLSKYSFIYGFIVPAVLISFSLLYIFRFKESYTVEKYECERIGKDNKSRILIFICMFFTVFFRQYIGTLLNYEFKQTFIYALLFTVCICLGKFSGGIFADKTNAVYFYLVTQILCTVFMVLSLYFEGFAFAAIFLFNLTMPITASFFYRAFPDYPGTVFGATTLAIYLGVLPSLLHVNPFVNDFFAILIFGIMAAVTLMIGLLKGRVS